MKSTREREQRAKDKTAIERDTSETAIPDAGERATAIAEKAAAQERRNRRNALSAAAKDRQRKRDKAVLADPNASAKDRETAERRVGKQKAAKKVSKQAQQRKDKLALATDLASIQDVSLKAQVEKQQREARERLDRKHQTAAKSRLTNARPKAEAPPTPQGQPVLPPQANSPPRPPPPPSTAHNAPPEADDIPWHEFIDPAIIKLWNEQ